MTTLTVYDPVMCCATDLCGTDADQRWPGPCDGS